MIYFLTTFWLYILNSDHLLTIFLFHHELIRIWSQLFLTILVGHKYGQNVHRNGRFRHNNLGCKKWQSAQETLSGRSRLFPPCFWTSRNFVNSALVTDALAIHKVVLDASVANAKSLVVLLDSQVLVRMLQAKDSRTGINGIMFHILRLMQWQNQISLFVNSVSNFFYKFIVLYQKIKKSP